MESKRPEWEVRIYGSQLNDIDTDLIAHIVVMLGREIMKDTAETQEDPSDSPPA